MITELAAAAFTVAVVSPAGRRLLADRPLPVNTTASPVVSGGRVLIRRGLVRRISARVSTAGRRRSSRPTDVDLAGWCDDLARRIRTGASLSSAIDAQRDDGVGARRDDAIDRWAAPCRHALTRGEPAARAVALLDTASPGPRLVVHVLELGARFGGPLADALERAAATLRSRAAIEAERRAMAAQAETSAKVLTVVPLGALALSAVAEPDVRAALTTTLGIACLITGVVLNLIGARWMRSLVAGAR